MTTIFITIPWFSPAYKAGGPVRSIANLVLALQGEFNFYIFCGNRDVDDELLDVKTNQWLQQENHLHIWYDDNTNRSKNLETEVKKINPDFLYINGIYSYHFNLVPLVFVEGPRKILATRGMLHPGALGQKRWKKLTYLALLKKFGYFNKVTLQAVDEEEEGYIHKIIGEKTQVQIVPNISTAFTPKTCSEKKTGVLNLISIGLISPMKNYLAVINALQWVKARVNYQIYGAIKDYDFWQQCLTSIEKLPGNISVKYKGSLKPDKVEESLAANEVFVLPSESENFGHAIGEALSAGLPVITSQGVPWKELNVNQAGLNINPTAEEIAKAIDFFAMMDPEEYEVWQRGAAKYFEKKDQRQNAIAAYRQLFSIEKNQ